MKGSRLRGVKPSRLVFSHSDAGVTGDFRCLCPCSRMAFSGSRENVRERTITRKFQCDLSAIRAPDFDFRWEHASRLDHWSAITTLVELVLWSKLSDSSSRARKYGCLMSPSVSPTPKCPKWMVQVLGMASRHSGTFGNLAWALKPPRPTGASR